MLPYPARDPLLTFDTDGTTIGALHAVEHSILRHDIDVLDYCTCLPLSGAEPLPLSMTLPQRAIHRTETLTADTMGH